VIRSFRDKDTARVFARESVRRWSSELQHVALRKRRMLDAAMSLDDLRVPPANRLEKLKRDRRGSEASAPMISGASASAGKARMRTTWS
jgi:proteic killer suppression protein